jgi:hypothetical protein
MTPEGKVKRLVSALLKSYGDSLYYEMPVPSGFGKSGLDYNGAMIARAFAVETKKPGGKPTPRQEETIKAMRRAGIAVFVVDGLESMAPLKQWLDSLQEFG